MIGLVAVVLIFGLPVIGILTSHHRKVLELKAKMGGTVDSNVAAELSELKKQVSELRDTTTRYDLSFDAALQRMESRMGHMEQRIGKVEQASPSVEVHRGG